MSTPNQVVVSQISDVTTVEITTVGPQGPAAAGFTFNGDNKVNDSIVYYDSTSDTFKADATTTKLTLVDGGNF
jgi:hypothetical protein|tara:strand:+ start:314 stop:532 length:219 start_codon:yes stop_codon:yes gene_type:complete